MSRLRNFWSHSPLRRVNAIFLLTDSLPQLSLSTLKTDAGRRSLGSLEAEVEKLHQLQTK